MSWPVEIFDGLMESIPADINKITGIDAYNYTQAPQPGLDPHIYIQYGGCILEPPDPLNFAQTGQQTGLLCRIPMEIVLEFKGSGDTFAGLSLLYSAMAGKYCHRTIRTIGVSSIDFTKQNKISLEDINVIFKGLNARLHIEENPESVSLKEQGTNDSWLFQQVWNARLQFRLSDQTGE